MNLFNISIVYTLISVASLSYVVFKKRTFDFFTVLILSSFFYFSPLLIGEININGFVNGEPISDVTYYFCMSYFSLLAIFVFIFDLFFINNDVKTFRLLNREVFSNVFYISLILFFVGVALVGLGNLLEPDKTKLANQNVAIYGLGLWFLMAVLIVAYANKNWVVFTVCVLCLIFSLYVGSRSNIAIAILTLVLLTLRNNKIRLYSQYSKFIFLSVFISLLILFKITYKYIKAFDFSMAYERLSSFDFFSMVNLVLVDPNAVVYNLNYTIVNNVSLDSDFIFHRLLSLFPMMAGLFQLIMDETFPRYSAVLADFYSIHFGLASSLHGEIIAMSGTFGFFIFITLFFTITFFLNYRYLFNPSPLILLSLPFVVYNLFYAFRVDLTFMFGTFKTYFVLVFLVVLLNYFRKNLLRK